MPASAPVSTLEYTSVSRIQYELSRMISWAEEQEFDSIFYEGYLSHKHTVKDTKLKIAKAATSSIPLVLSVLHFTLNAFSSYSWTGVDPFNPLDMLTEPMLIRNAFRQVIRWPPS